MAAALEPQVSHLTTPAREGPTRELVCLPSGVPTEEHHEERPRGGGQELCRWPRGGSSGLGPGHEGLGAGSVVCWELEGSSQGWGRHTIPLPAGSPELHNSSRRGWLYTMGKENWREDPSFCPRSLLLPSPPCPSPLRARPQDPAQRPKPEQITASRNEKAQSPCSFCTAALDRCYSLGLPKWECLYLAPTRPGLAKTLMTGVIAWELLSSRAPLSS